MGDVLAPKWSCVLCFEVECEVLSVCPISREIIHKDNMVKWEQKCQTLEAQIGLLKELQEEQKEKSESVSSENQNEGWFPITSAVL